METILTLLAGPGVLLLLQKLQQPSRDRRS